MLIFVPGKDFDEEVLLPSFKKKTSAESYRLLVKVYSERALTQKTCERWLKHFKSGDFHVKDKKRLGQLKKFQDADLQALLDEDSTQILKQLTEALNVVKSTITESLHALGK